MTRQSPVKADYASRRLVEDAIMKHSTVLNPKDPKTRVWAKGWGFTQAAQSVNKKFSGNIARYVAVKLGLTMVHPTAPERPNLTGNAPVSRLVKLEEAMEKLQAERRNEYRNAEALAVLADRLSKVEATFQALCDDLGFTVENERK